MADDGDPIRPTDFHPQPDGEHLRPLELHTQPDVHTQPDYHVLPDERPVPRPPIVERPVPTDPPDGCFPVVSREELEMALYRAQLVMDDCTSVLSPAVRAMDDGAWVSRRADEFSDGLTTHARLAGSIAERCVEVIQEALDTRGDIDVEPAAL